MIFYNGKSLSLPEVRRLSDLSSFKKKEQNNELKFVFPEGLFQLIDADFTGKEKNKYFDAYKIWYLRNMLAFIYPEEKVSEISKILVKRYSCFKQHRTMQELYALFLKKIKYFENHI